MAGGYAIELACGDCGEVRVDADQVDVHRNPRDGFAIYAFSCPSCRQVVAGGCASRIVELEARGARRFELRSTAAPAISYDDLLSFHEWLHSDVAWPPDASPSGSG